MLMAGFRGPGMMRVDGLQCERQEKHLHEAARTLNVIMDFPCDNWRAAGPLAAGLRVCTGAGMRRVESVHCERQDRRSFKAAYTKSHKRRADVPMLSATGDWRGCRRGCIQASGGWMLGRLLLVWSLTLHWPSAYVCLLQAEQLTPAQQAARRKNKKGNPLDGLMMVMSLVKRW